MFKKITGIIIALGSALYLVRRYYIWPSCNCERDLKGKLIIVTGTTSGIGLATVQQLASKGASLLLACRNTEKAHQIAADLKLKTSNPHIHVEFIDFSSLAHVAEFVQKFKLTDRSDIYALVNNAGIFYAEPETTVDNFDITYQTNFLGQFLLTLLLLPALRRHPGSRIVFLSSEAHLHSTVCPRPEFLNRFEDTPNNRFEAYQYSKFCLVLFAFRLKECLHLSNITVHCVDPGNTETQIYRYFPQLSDPLLFALQKPLRLFLVKTPFEASQNILHALRAPEPPFYIKNLQPINRINYNIFNPIFADVLWQMSRRHCEQYLTASNSLL